MRNFFPPRSLDFNDRHTRLSQVQCQNDYRHAYFHLILTHESVLPSWALTDPAVSREDLFGLFHLHFTWSHKTWCILLFIQFQPYPWPDLILLCWHMLYVCVQQSPSCEGIYLPGILKTDLTEPSTSKGYWDRMVMWIPPAALWVGTKGEGWEHNEVINIYIHEMNL